jgi:putative spermidine/putrescine transport system permease protein
MSAAVGHHLPAAAARGGAWRRRPSRYWLLVAPALLLMLVFYILPVLSVLLISVTEPEPGLGNYALLATSGPIHRVLATTARISAITTAVTLVLGYVLAYGLVHAGPAARRWLLLGVVLPLWVSVLVRAFSWVTILRRQGLLNTALLELGLVEEPLRLLFNEFAICLGMVHYMLPYAVLPLFASMRGIDLRLVAAARGLGASRFAAFRRVFLPLSLPGIVGAGVLVFIFSLGFLVTPAILGGGRTRMIAEYMSWLILERLQWGPGTMLATVLAAAVLLLLWMLGRVVDLRRLFGAAT